MNEVPYEFVQAGGYVGPDFTAVFFFQDVFWRLTIPLVFGNYRVNTTDALQTMPGDVRQRLISRERDRKAFVLHWADCFDYDYGRSYVKAQPPNAEVAELVGSADRDLMSAIGDLSQHAPNPNAMFNARLATEKVLKAFLCSRHGFTVASVWKQFHHDVAALISEIARRDPASELSALQANVFPAYADRYSDKPHSRLELWDAYRTAQFAGASLMRVLTPYNQRAAAMNAA